MNPRCYPGKGSYCREDGEPPETLPVELLVAGKEGWTGECPDAYPRGKGTHGICPFFVEALAMREKGELFEKIIHESRSFKPLASYFRFQE